MSITDNSKSKTNPPLGIISYNLWPKKSHNLTMYDVLDSSNSGLLKSWHLLDGAVFGSKGMSADPWVKNDCTAIGGASVILLADKDTVPQECSKCLDATDLEKLPVGFADIQMTNKDTYVITGFGIIEPFRGKGLSKYLLHSMAKLYNAKKFTITTQYGEPANNGGSADKSCLGCGQGRFPLPAYLHFGPLEILRCYGVLHNKWNTFILRADPQPYNKIFGPLKNKNDGWIYISEGEMVLGKKDKDQQLWQGLNKEIANKNHYCVVGWNSDTGDVMVKKSQGIVWTLADNFYPVA